MYDKKYKNMCYYCGMDSSNGDFRGMCGREGG